MNAFRAAMIWQAFALSCLLLLAFPPGIVLAQERPTYCKDPANADLTLRCLSLLNLRSPENRSCAELREIYQDGIRQLGTLPSAPSCEMFASAVEALTGSQPSWAACIGNNVGTKEHVARCLASTRDAASMSCEGIRRAYDTALRQTGTPVRQPIRCDIAAAAIKVLNDGKPAAWEPCLFYEPGGRHGLQCLQGKTAQFASCGEAMDLYGELLRSAYGGSLPNNYRAANCDEFGPLIAQAAAEAAARKAAATQASSPVPSSGASTPRTPVGVDWSPVTNTILIFVLAIAGLIAFSFLYWRHANDRNLKRTQAPTQSEAEIRQMAQEKRGEFAYAGTASANFMVNLGGPDKDAIRTLEFSFRIVRNLAAMTHREREFVKIYQFLHSRGWLDPRADERIHFGLAWGDGKGAVGAHEYHIPQTIARQHGINTIGDAIRWYAREIGVNTESAISELLTAFDQLKSSMPQDPLVKEIDATIASGNRWFTSADIHGSEFADSGKRPGLFLGLHPEDGSPCHYYGERSLITVAPPGAGKTQCHIIPNLLIWPGPAVVLDIKGELWEKTSAVRASLGPVYRFAPLDLERSHAFNPLSAVRSDPAYLWEDATNLAEFMVVPQATKDPFFEQSAQRVLAGFIAYVCRKTPSPELRSMSDVLDLASGVGIDDYIDESELAHDMRQLVREARALSQMPENTRQNVLAQLTTSLRAWSGGRIERAVSGSDWSPSILREKNATIYICVNPHEVESLLSVLRVVIGQHINTLTQIPPKPGLPSEALFFLDEFPQLRQMTPIEKGLEVARSYGLRMWLITQSLAQIKAYYGVRAEGLVGMCGIRAFMNPPLHDGTAQKLSEDIGFFESVIDNHRQRIVEPQALAGPEFQDDILVLGASAKPMRLKKLRAIDDAEMKEYLGEVSWPPPNN